MGNHRRYELDGLSAPALALLIERHFVDQWPLEVTAGGRRFIQQAPEQNVYRRALLGDDSGITVKVKLHTERRSQDPARTVPPTDGAR